MKVAEELERLADAEYRSFHLKLVPGIDAARVLGVRIPLIRALAKRMDAAEKDAFLTVLPHYYYEENVLHAVIVSGSKTQTERRRKSRVSALRRQLGCVRRDLAEVFRQEGECGARARSRIRVVRQHAPVHGALRRELS